MNIFNYIKNLKFENEPNYEYIINQLLILKNKEIQKICYNYEIQNQILNLQKNLTIKSSNENHEQKNNSIKITDQDNIIYKLNKTANKSIPSLKSTNYSTSIYYKANYINCISNNNNENFYQSVLKLGNSSNNKICMNNNISLNNNKKYYNFNNNINIYPYKFNLDDDQKIINNNNINTQEAYLINSIEKNEQKVENDKSLIEFFIGKPINYLSKKRKIEKNKKTKNIKMNMHNKRKKLKFRIVKKET
jgi:hypothetical protein